MRSTLMVKCPWDVVTEGFSFQSMWISRAAHHRVALWSGVLALNNGTSGSISSYWVAPPHRNIHRVKLTNTGRNNSQHDCNIPPSVISKALMNEAFVKANAAKRCNSGLYKASGISRISFYRGRDSDWFKGFLEFGCFNPTEIVYFNPTRNG